MLYLTSAGTEKIPVRQRVTKYPQNSRGKYDWANQWQQLEDDELKSEQALPPSPC